MIYICICTVYIQIKYYVINHLILLEIQNILNQQLAEETNKPIIRKFGKQKVYSSLKDNIGGADLADMQLISK